MKVCHENLAEVLLPDFLLIGAVIRQFETLIGRDPGTRLSKD